MLHRVGIAGETKGADLCRALTAGKGQHSSFRCFPDEKTEPQEDWKAIPTTESRSALRCHTAPPASSTQVCSLGVSVSKYPCSNHESFPSP